MTVGSLHIYICLAQFLASSACSSYRLTHDHHCVVSRGRNRYHNRCPHLASWSTVRPTLAVSISMRLLLLLLGLQLLRAFADNPLSKHKKQTNKQAHKYAWAKALKHAAGGHRRKASTIYIKTTMKIISIETWTPLPSGLMVCASIKKKNSSRNNIVIR